ncbi:MAG: uroporphyrinogen-III C-methyltransferase [bacterium]|nr:uroporphyrinogen-III C-methyltransferase [bacterium]
MSAAREDTACGTVHLVGAGPGDPELITVRGLRLLRAADVVIHDRLVAHALLDEVGADAEVINAGKHPGHQRLTQQEINALLTGRAREGLAVVRLKGGDPFVFGRGGEEVQACVEAGVPVVVVPGISSAHAVPAAVGIPVTHRGLGRAYAVVTGQTDPQCGSSELPYASLAGLDTVIVLMGRSNLAEITARLMAAGRAGSTPASCVEMGCTPEQRSVLGTLETIAAQAAAHPLRAPVVTVIGEVVSMSAALDLAPALSAHASLPLSRSKEEGAPPHA